MTTPFLEVKRKIDPIISTDWLAGHSKDIVVIDIRTPADYAAGHIPGSINEPFVTSFDATCRGPSSHWIIGSSDCIWLEVPNITDLSVTIGNLGISGDSLVAIVTASNSGEPPFYGFANAARVAVTLIYAGVRNVAVVDGGYPKWAAEHRSISQSPPKNATPVAYHATVNESIFVSIEHIRKAIGKGIIIDARDANVYFGEAIEPLASKAGHIPTACSLPAPWLWEWLKFNDNDGTYIYKSEKIIRAMASGVIGKHGGGKKEIIVYCGAGGYASAWWFVLTQVLGYQDIKFYDGSAQEWSKKDYDMIPYEWE